MVIRGVVWLALIGFILVCPSGVWAEDLPSRLKAEGLNPDGQVRRAADLPSLFQAINGGAESYVKYGFQRASWQSYKASDGRIVNIDLFEMKNPDAAKAVYAEKTGQSGRKLKIKDEGIVEEYYLMFRQGRFYVVLTGEIKDPQVIEKLTATARIVEGWIADHGEKPLF